MHPTPPLVVRGRRRRRVALAALVVAICWTASVPAGAGDAGLSGVVVNRKGVPLADVTVTVDGLETSTESDGRFHFPGSPGGTVRLARVGYAPRSIEWAGDGFMFVTMAPRLVRGLHVAGWVASAPSGFQRMLDIGAATSVNALVIDVKDEAGRVYHRSQVPAVAGIGAAYRAQFDLAERVERARAQGFYVIARIVAFQDPIAALARPAWAVTDVVTGQPLARGTQRFLDPHDPAARQYALDLASEVCDLGVDEVQFDYVRFPDGGLLDAAFDGPKDAASRVAAITGFLREARARLQPLGCATAADIFGWITHTTTDGGIGQQLEAIAGAVDVVSPMVYPSHYDPGWYGFDDPNAHPGPVVTNGVLDALRRLTESQAVLRPWLQDFWYSAGQVETQIMAADDLGLGWMLWNVNSTFTVGGIPGSTALRADESVPQVVGGELPASSFYDVPDGDPFAADVGWLARQGITTGCNPPWNDFFCPGDPVTRGQMAAFLTRGLDLDPGAGDPFWDDDGSVFEGDIQALAAAGVTRGCNPPHNTRYCPDEPVTRAEMAAFLRRALTLPPGGGDPFWDDDGSVFEEDIEALAAAGVTRGCNPPDNTRYCPAEAVTRGQMAAFLHRALG